MQLVFRIGIPSSSGEIPIVRHWKLFGVTFDSLQIFIPTIYAVKIIGKLTMTPLPPVETAYLLNTSLERFFDLDDCGS